MTNSSKDDSQFYKHLFSLARLDNYILVFIVFNKLYNILQKEIFVIRIGLLPQMEESLD